MQLVLILLMCAASAAIVVGYVRYARGNDPASSVDTFNRALDAMSISAAQPPVGPAQKDRQPQ